MDKELLGDDLKKICEGSNESLDDKIKNMERRKKLARTAFAIDPDKEKNKNIGRTVFYITVGQMKHTQIVLKTVSM
jgi:hypothetical protein